MGLKPVVQSHDQTFSSKKHKMSTLFVFFFFAMTGARLSELYDYMN